VALAAASVAVPRPAPADEIDEGIRFKSLAVQGNPLDLAIGRYSADLEYLPDTHHTLHFTPFAYYALPGASDQLTGFGGELGYRWYSGTHGAHGFFIGGSFIAAELEYTHKTSAPGALDTPDDTQFTELGGAVDVGYQVIVLGNLATGVGAGAQYLVDKPRPQFEFLTHPWHDLLYGPGMRPRLLLSVGAAF
jgi:hypothetical protein